LPEADVGILDHDTLAAPVQKLGQGMTLGSLDGLRVVVLAEPTVRGTLKCDAAALVNCRPVPCSVAGQRRGGEHPNRPGACYADVVSGLELLCVQGGHGELSYGGRPLHAVPMRTFRAGVRRTDIQWA
jgi:hypothetical protein